MPRVVTGYKVVVPILKKGAEVGSKPISPKLTCISAAEQLRDLHIKAGQTAARVQEVYGSDGV